MCYSPIISLMTFFEAIIFSWLLYVTYDKVIAAFFAFVALMQLYDYIFWKSQEYKTLNMWTTRMAMITNYAQPIVLAIFIVYLGGQRLKPLSMYLVSVYTLAAFLYVISMWDKVRYTATCEMSSVRGLIWEWNYQRGCYVVHTLFLLCVIMLFLEHFKWPIKWFLAIIGILSFMFSFTYIKVRAVGRMWCWFVGLMPLFMYILYWSLDK